MKYNGQHQTESKRSTRVLRERCVLGGEGAPIWSVAFSPEGDTLATASEDGCVTLWDLASEKERLRIRAHSLGANAVAFAPLVLL